MITRKTGITTARQLHEAGDIGRCELLRGELRMMSPAGRRQGLITSRLTAVICRHVEATSQGEVYAAETGFVLARDPDTVRAPDIAFIRATRLAECDPIRFLTVPPDLAVEVLSPSDRAGEVQQKVADWLAFGTATVWVVDPAGRTVTVHEPGGRARVHHDDELLRGGDVLPGFEYSLRQLFE